MVKVDRPERSRLNRSAFPGGNFSSLGSDPKFFRPSHPPWPIGELRIFSHDLDPLIDHPVVDLLDLALPDCLGDAWARL